MPSNSPNWSPDVTRLQRIRTSMALLQQNSEGCAANHYGHDTQALGMPAWLADTRADLDALTDILAASGEGMSPLHWRSRISESASRLRRVETGHRLSEVYDGKDAEKRAYQVRADLGVLLAGFNALAASPKATATASVREGQWRCKGCGWVGKDAIGMDHPQNGCDLELMRFHPATFTDSGTADTHAGSGEVEAVVVSVLTKRAEYFERTPKGAFNREDAARSYRATITEVSKALAALHPVDSRAQGGEKA